MFPRRPFAALAAVLLFVAPATRAESPAELAETARRVAALQNPDGGFAAEAGGKSTLGTTSSAVRVLGNVRGSVGDVPACIAFVRSCYDADSGGFAPTPGGDPDVHTTAVGLMAISALKIPAPEMTEGAAKYLAGHAKAFEDVRIAVAGLEAIAAKSDAFPAWTTTVNADRNPDGTWGEGPAKARATGSAAAALLRMGVELDRRDAVVAAIRDGQGPDGGWSKDGSDAELETTYRVMRCLFMLGEAPDLDALRDFIARCRAEGGLYAVAPGGEPGLGGTYFATTVLGWARQLAGEPAFVETAGFRPLLRGDALDGWEGNTSLWSVDDGVLVGRSPGLDHNEFLATEETFGDFILKLTFRLKDGSGNSGVQFRSVRVPGTEMSGYQADIGEGYWGCLYDESRRNRVLVPASDPAKARLRPAGWNQYVVRCLGDHITLSLNDAVSVDYHEEDAAIARDGKLATQIHAGGPMEVRFKDLYIQKLPRPEPDDAATPGFHLRTVRAPDGDRRYTVYLPEGYDGTKAFPVVLFLHGAGERGDDGVIPAQVGLGPAIANEPVRFPAIVVFPQARRTWAADSPDGAGALAALDDVQETFKTDPDRVVVSGLSMGGFGSWQMAAAHPDRFSAVVPVCGFSPVETAQAVRGLPVWTFLGDADNPRIVQGTRALVAALKSAGASPRSTEYRNVGHNSWDRAYADPDLVDWMLSQTRAAK